MRRLALVIFLLLQGVRIAAEPSLAPTDGRSATSAPTAESSRVQSGYLNYSDIVSRLEELESEYPEIAEVVNLNQLLHTPLTVEGRVLWALKISDRVREDEDEPAVIIDGLHHARELLTPLAVLDVAEVLTAQYGINLDVTRWVDHYEIWLVPCVNPDGLTYVFRGHLDWRKNRRPNGDGSYGVDLNRNYPFMWGVCGATSGDTRSDVYRGPSPGSEAEVQTMLALGARKRPVLYISYHSAGEEVLYPYRCAKLAEESVYYAIRDQYATAMQYGMRLASASGESFEHFYNQFGSIAFLTEIGRAFQPPASSIPAILQQIRPGWQYLLNRVMGPLIQGHVKNALTGQPVTDATISLDGITFREGEVRRPEPVFGRYHWIVQPGVYTVRFTAPGFESQSFLVTVMDEAVSLEVNLAPKPGVTTGMSRVLLHPRTTERQAQIDG